LQAEAAFGGPNRHLAVCPFQRHIARAGRAQDVEQLAHIDCDGRVFRTGLYRLARLQTDLHFHIAGDEQSAIRVVLDEHIGEVGQGLAALDDARSLSEQLEQFIAGRRQSVHSFFSFIQNRTDSKGRPVLWIRQKTLYSCGLRSSQSLWTSGLERKDGLEQLDRKRAVPRLIQKLFTHYTTTCSF